MVKLIASLLFGIIWVTIVQSADAQTASVDGSLLSKQKELKLHQDWMIFPEQIISPQQFIQRLERKDLGNMALAIPGHGFQSDPAAYGNPNFGFSTYVLRLSNIPQGRYGGYGMQAYSSSRVYVFNASNANTINAVLDQGLNPEAPENSRPIMTSQPSFFFQITSPQDHYLLIQVANFHHGWGGLWKTPTLGSESLVDLTVHRNTQIDYLTIGTVFFVFLYSFALYLRRREDLASLALSLCALSYVVRTFLFTQWSSNLFGDWSITFEVTFKLVYIWFTAGALLFIWFLRQCFPEVCPKWYVTAAVLSQAPIYGLIILLPTADHYNLSKPLLDVSTMLINITNSVVLLLAVIKKQNGSWYCLIGYLLAIAGAINDLLWTQDKPYLFVPAVGVGYSLFFVLNSQIVAQRFAEAFRNSEALSKNLQAEVDRQTRDIKTILRHIKQGIFTIDSVKQPIGKDHSDYLGQLLGFKEIEDKNLNDAFLCHTNLDNDQKDQLINALDIALGEDELNFEGNRSLLPTEILYHRGSDHNDRTFMVDWNPVLDPNDCLEKVLVSIRDITELKQLEAENKQRELDMQMLIELVQIPEDRFQRFIVQTKAFLNDNIELIKLTQKPRPELIKRLFINMHTIKGAARTLLLKALSNSAHEIEQVYQGLQKETIPWNRDRLLEELSTLHDTVKKYQHIGEEKLGWLLTERTIKIPAKICESMASHLLKLYQTQLSEKQHYYLDDIRTLVFDYGFLKLDDILSEAFAGIDSMARDLKKETPRITLHAEHVLLTDQGVNLLHGMLVHMIRNSMDHGIELPEERQKWHKEIAGEITVETLIDLDHQLKIEYRDDGAGLDLFRIRKCAEKEEFITDSEAISEQETAELIFHSGLTTKDAASEISGRGVGMDAIRNFIRDKGGDIQIVLLDPSPYNAFRPFILRITMPQDLWFSAKPIYQRPKCSA